jgi:Domain of unknown function(DUF2779)
MRYLTKGRFMLAMECPTKLIYRDNSHYANRIEDDEFLKALADSGHQVGALARTLLGPGELVEEIEHEAAVSRTLALLERDNVRIYEAAIRWERCFIRVDLLEKVGDSLKIFEVKAKSYDLQKGNVQIVGRSGLLSEFSPYVYDVAFQRYVTRKALPGCRVSASLVFVSKRSNTPTALLPKLRVSRTGKSATVVVAPELEDGEAARACLSVVTADGFADRAEAQPLKCGGYNYSFEEGIQELMNRLDSNPFAPRPGKYCRRCEFRALPTELARGMRDGRAECWETAFGISAAVMRNGSVLDLHKFTALEDLIADGKLRLTDVTHADLMFKEEADRISATARNWLQSEESRGALKNIQVWNETIKAELKKVRYPLHFVDFETARPALPVHDGRRTYEQILFQFSHHELTADKALSHTSEYLFNPAAGFPNYDVLRALRTSLQGDDGTVIHWWDHERTTLIEIRRQLEAENEGVPDKVELIDFIDSLVGTETRPTRLFDLGKLFERAVYVPGTKGSSSLKKVLVALLVQSEVLRQKYGGPNYGAAEGIPSKNFRDFTWVRFDDEGCPIDPYKLLDPRFSDPALARIDEMEDEEVVVADGGAAMVAYSVLESGQLSPDEKNKIRVQLLRYCELDTLAMVMAWDALESAIA